VASLSSAGETTPPNFTAETVPLTVAQALVKFLGAQYLRIQRRGAEAFERHFHTRINQQACKTYEEYKATQRLFL
jgi:hypothetical protein